MKKWPVQGSISAEHGVGQCKPDYLYLNKSDEAMALMGAVKKVMDPNLILNPQRCAGVGFVSEFCLCADRICAGAGRGHGPRGAMADTGFALLHCASARPRCSIAASTSTGCWCRAGVSSSDEGQQNNSR